MKLKRRFHKSKNNRRKSPVRGRCDLRQLFLNRISRMTAGAHRVIKIIKSRVSCFMLNINVKHLLSFIILMIFSVGARRSPWKVGSKAHYLNERHGQQVLSIILVSARVRVSVSAIYYGIIRNLRVDSELLTRVSCHGEK